jgi:hypothetical protein
MARPTRLDIEGGWYHVVNRGIERRAIFRAEGNYGLTTPNGKNRTLRPSRGRLEPRRRRKTSLERLFAGS